MLLLLKILMLVGVLDAVDLTAIARCSRELKEATDEIWEGVRKKNAATRLRLVERRVDNSAKNNSKFTPYAPVDQAGGCVCGELTRFRHPVDGTPVCAPCGTRAESAPVWSPLFQFRMIAVIDALHMFCISTKTNLGQHLPHSIQHSSNRQVVVTYARIGVSTGRRVCKYAPGFVDSGKDAGKRPTAPPEDNDDDGDGMKVFLLKDVACLMLEKFGGRSFCRSASATKICRRSPSPIRTSESGRSD